MDASALSFSVSRIQPPIDRHPLVDLSARHAFPYYSVQPRHRTTNRARLGPGLARVLCAILSQETWLLRFDRRRSGRCSDMLGRRRTRQRDEPVSAGMCCRGLWVYSILCTARRSRCQVKGCSASIPLTPLNASDKPMRLN